MTIRAIAAGHGWYPCSWGVLALVSLLQAQSVFAQNPAPSVAATDSTTATGPTTSNTAPAGETLTLAAAVAQALQQRPLLSGDAERIEVARARVTAARVPLLPRFAFQASATDGPTGAPPLGLEGLVGTPLKKHYGASFNLVKTLLDFGRTHNTVRARQEETVASAEAQRADHSRVVLEVQQAFLQALEARRLSAVNRQLVEQRQLVARQAETLRQNGLGTRVDVDLAEVNVAQAQLALVRANNDIEVAYAALSTAIGHTLTPATPLQDVLAPLPAPLQANPAVPPATEPPPATTGAAVPALDDAIKTALQNRPELRQAAAQTRVYEYLAEAARAGGRPQINGVGSVGKINPLPAFKAGDKPWAVGIAVTIPLFAGPLTQGQVAEARHNANASRDNVNELINTVRQQVVGAVANLTATSETVRVAQAQLVTAEDALSLATQRYEARLGSIIELSQAQVAEATAQNDLVHAQYDQELARAALAYATGQDFAGAPVGGANTAATTRSNGR